MDKTDAAFRFAPLTDEHLPQVRDLYRAAGWIAYLRDPDALARAFARSLYVLGAFDGERLAGFCRCVGDGEHVVLVQDLLVGEPYRRRGLGTALLRAAAEKYRGVRMFFAVTDSADGRANAFWHAAGMTPLGGGGMRSYFRSGTPDERGG
jgi:GNAT superfamily N-acetyltransferase